MTVMLHCSHLQLWKGVDCTQESFVVERRNELQLRKDHNPCMI